MAAPSTSYEPRHPAQGPLYQIVRDHFETFRAQAASVRDGEGLPRFVEDEFRGFLQCGWLAGGFARFRCGDCGLDDATVIDRILRHLGVPTEVPALRPARPPPLHDGVSDVAGWDDETSVCAGCS